MRQVQYSTVQYILYLVRFCSSKSCNRYSTVLRIYYRVCSTWYCTSTRKNTESYIYIVLLYYTFPNVIKKTKSADDDEIGIGIYSIHQYWHSYGTVRQMYRGLHSRCCCDGTKWHADVGESLFVL